MKKLIARARNHADKALFVAGTFALANGAQAAIDVAAVTSEIDSGKTTVETIIVAMLGFGVLFLVGRSLYGLVKR